MHERIAFVKTGWSDDYQGGLVRGRHAHVQEFDEAHEKYNFRRHSDGKFYGYVPPIGPRESPPRPKINTGWLLIFVSARNGNGPLTVVDWYENATFCEEYTPRPEYDTTPSLERDVHGQKYSYCIEAERAHLIPTSLRSQIISGDHFKRTPILYARGNGKMEPWRRALASDAEAIRAKNTKTRSGPPTFVFPDAAHRMRVEKAAIAEAKKYLLTEHHVRDRQKDNCGYDLLARHRATSNELHVEVKGTSSAIMHFYLSKKEFDYMHIPQWRLIVVCEALGRPRLEIFTAQEARRVFAIDPFAWEGMFRV